MFAFLQDTCKTLPQQKGLVLVTVYLYIPLSVEVMPGDVVMLDDVKDTKIGARPIVSTKT